MAAQGSVGEQLWAATSLEGVTSAVRTRLGRTFALRFSREVQLGKWEQSGAALVKASPQDKTAYFSTSGVGLTTVVPRAARFSASEVLPESPPEGDKGAKAARRRREPRRHSRATALSILPDEAGWDLIQVRPWPPRARARAHHV